MPKPLEIGLVNSCVYFAHQTRETYQALLSGIQNSPGSLKSTE